MKWDKKKWLWQVPWEETASEAENCSFPIQLIHLIGAHSPTSKFTPWEVGTAPLIFLRGYFLYWSWMCQIVFWIFVISSVCRQTQSSFYHTPGSSLGPTDSQAWWVEDLPCLSPWQQSLPLIFHLFILFRCWPFNQLYGYLILWINLVGLLQKCTYLFIFTFILQ